MQRRNRIVTEVSVTEILRYICSVKNKRVLHLPFISIAARNCNSEKSNKLMKYQKRCIQ